MSIVRIAIASLLIATVGGCSTVHSSDDSTVVGYWIGSKPETHQLVADVLRDHGIDAATDAKGVHVADEQSMKKAYEVLLEDERLRGSGLMLSVCALAGTGRATPDGYEVSIFKAPGEPAKPASEK